MRVWAAANTPRPRAGSTVRTALIFGGSGQIGAPLLHRLLRGQWQVVAVSRHSQPHTSGLRWVAGDLAAPPPLPRQVDAIFSCGPLDAFARWYAASNIEAACVVAFGSTSVATKHRSDDPHERDLAARLREGEERVFAAAHARAAAATVLRPTLVYGAGRDATLTRIAGLARRFRCFALPRGACGLRQPVHVEDLAEAAWSAAGAGAGAGASAGRAYDLPGGETLAYREMVARVLAALQPPAALLELPAPVFRLALHAARISGRASGFSGSALQRLREDLVFDAGPAQRALGYAPRPFAPEAAMFVAPAPAGARSPV